MASLAHSGCAPTVNLLGVYFPGWLISAIFGVASAYLMVWWLGNRAGARELAQSGLFFVSLTLVVTLLLWWLLYGPI